MGDRVRMATYRAPALPDRGDDRRRQGELLALRWRDVDWLVQKVRVRQNYVRGELRHAEVEALEPRRAAGASASPASWTTATRPRAYQADDDLVFGHPHTGAPLDRSQVLQALQALGRGRRPPHPFHDLRHTFGTQMAAAGVPMRTLRSGWATRTPRRPRSTRTTAGRGGGGDRGCAHSRGSGRGTSHGYPKLRRTRGHRTGAETARVEPRTAQDQPLSRVVVPAAAGSSPVAHPSVPPARRDIPSSRPHCDRPCAGRVMEGRVTGTRRSSSPLPPIGDPGARHGGPLSCRECRAASARGAASPFARARPDVEDRSGGVPRRPRA